MATWVIYREDQTEVCTLSDWVCPHEWPYPPYYWAAFAFSVISYPLLRPPSLRSRYHVCGEHRAYPVVDEEEYVRHGWRLYPGERIGCRRPHVDEAVLLTYLLVVAYQPLWPLGHSRGFMMTLHFRSTLPAFPSATSRSFCLVVVTRFGSRPSQTDIEHLSDDFNVTLH